KQRFWSEHRIQLLHVASFVTGGEKTVLVKNGKPVWLAQRSREIGERPFSCGSLPTAWIDVACQEWTICVAIGEPSVSIREDGWRDVQKVGRKRRQQLLTTLRVRR